MACLLSLNTRTNPDSEARGPGKKSPNDGAKEESAEDKFVRLFVKAVKEK
jgi:hypothetical protein